MPTSSQALPEGIVWRRRAYYSDFQVRGRRFRRKLSRNLTTARQLVLELRARAERGDVGLVDNDVSVAELKAAYLKACSQETKSDTLLRYRYNLAAILPHVPRRVSQVTTRAVHDYRQRRLGKVSPRTINSDVDTLCRMLRWGKAHGIIGSNPLEGLKPLPHDRPKEGRALEDAEVAQLLQASPQHWHDVWYAFAVTGMRQRELAGLRLSDIDWEARELIVQKSVAKSHRSRRIPIDGALWDLFCQRRAEAGDHDVLVFQNRRGGALSRGPVYRAFIRCCQRAGLQTRTLDAQGEELNHLDVHSLRKTFATNLIVHRTDPKTVMELLGHATVAITLNLYAKIHPGTKREAIGRLSYGAGTAAPAIIKLADSG